MLVSIVVVPVVVLVSTGGEGAQGSAVSGAARERATAVAAE